MRKREFEKSKMLKIQYKNKLRKSKWKNEYVEITLLKRRNNY